MPGLPGPGRRRRLTALFALCAGSCGAERRSSDGSLLEGPVTWQAEARLAGPDLDFRTLPPGNALPLDTLSVTVMAEGGGSELLSLGVRDPDGRWLVDPQHPEESANRVLRGRGRVVAMLPSASASLPLAARYLVAPARLSGAGGPVSISAWIKRGRGLVQELPLAVLMVGRVLDDARVDIALGEVGRIWRGAGIEVREPVRVRIEGSEGQALDRVVVDPALGNDSPMVVEALALAGRGPADALTLVVVADITVAGPGYPIWALSGGIPVPPAGGTARSGVLASAVLLEHDPLWAGQVMAHEIGHALGLYHTTEAALGSEAGAPASVVDPLDDTPACAASADRAPADGTLSAEECELFDAANLMFWAAVRGATALTAGQGAQARRSALAR
jgi:hypothetical protein